tara:strand:+ start:1330 stop:1608 length:279 start_codon:yes stop_codon:yes gene_type:complete
MRNGTGENERRSRSLQDFPRIAARPAAQRAGQPGGFLAVSECTWLTASPSDAARAFWEAAEAVLADAEAEIALFERNPGQYSYVFHVLRWVD